MTRPDRTGKAGSKRGKWDKSNVVTTKKPRSLSYFWVKAHTTSGIFESLQNSRKRRRIARWTRGMFLLVGLPMTNNNSAIAWLVFSCEMRESQYA